jgi:hypothetical protein
MAALRACAIVTAAAAVLAAGPASTIAVDVRAVLSHDLELTPAELADLERGRIVKHGLDASSPGEIAVVGAIRVNARTEAFVQHVRDIERFKRGPDVIQIGRFSSPPRVEDLDRLAIGHDDLDVRRCRVGDCDIRLSKEAIGRFRREIDWKAPDAEPRAAALFKQVLFENVRAYTVGGPGRITEYDDEKRPVRPLDDFAALLTNSRYVGGLVPGLPAHLRDMAGVPLPGADDFLYWSKEKFGLTPFITVTHVVIAQAPSGAYVIASRDVYSSRYFDASLSYTIASPAVGVSNAFYLVYANRSRAAALKGPLAGLRRAIVERRAKNALEETLKSMRARMETR